MWMRTRFWWRVASKMWLTHTCMLLCCGILTSTLKPEVCLLDCVLVPDIAGLLNYQLCIAPSRKVWELTLQVNRSSALVIFFIAVPYMLLFKILLCHNWETGERWPLQYTVCMWVLKKNLVFVCALSICLYVFVSKLLAAKLTVF